MPSLGEKGQSSMIHGQDIICFCNDWDADPLSKKHIMTRLAGAGNRILWINSVGNRRPTASARDLRRILKKLGDFAGGCKTVQKNISVFTPLALPFHGNALARWFNRLWMKMQIARACEQLDFRDPIVYTFVPWSADMAGNLGEKMVIYHITDEFTEFSGTNKAAILDMEQRLIDKSDAVLVSAERLGEKARSRGKAGVLITHGVDVTHFRKACDAHTRIPADIAMLDKPIIGFVGLIEDWVDLRLIRVLALARPSWSFVLIGKLVAGDSEVRDLPNVHFLGRKEYQELPGYCKAFDVALLPFVINELTLAANPLKLREYLAAGLPVVASALPEAERLDGLLSIARSDAEFLQKIEDLLAAGFSTSGRLHISESMDAETWDRKVEDISRIIEDHMVADHKQPGEQAAAA
jgi:glycosyltransferase involved in cell wall biosynthesis